MAGRGHSPRTSSSLLASRRMRLHMTPRKDTEDAAGSDVRALAHTSGSVRTRCVFPTKESQQLEPADLLVAAVAALPPPTAATAAGVHGQVSEVVELKQVDDGDVDELLGAEGLLQNQPLHTIRQGRLWSWSGSGVGGSILGADGDSPGTAPPVSPSGPPVCPDSCTGRRDRGT